MVVWSKSHVRIVRPEETTMLTAFGSCIMAEKSKIDFLGAGRSKQDFISSVSHELRSPLHGIMAAAEMFPDTSPNEHQDDLIRTINTCGYVTLFRSFSSHHYSQLCFKKQCTSNMLINHRSVLMDTLDHILEV